MNELKKLRAENARLKISLGNARTAQDALELKNAALSSSLEKCGRQLIAALDRELELGITIKTLPLQSGAIPRDDAEKITKEVLKNLEDTQRRTGLREGRPPRPPGRA